MAKKRTPEGAPQTGEVSSPQGSDGPSELEKLQALYKELQDRGITTISKLEFLIQQELQK